MISNVVKIESRRVYQVSHPDGTILGEFEVNSRWNGLTRLKNKQGESLIIYDFEGVADLFDRIAETSERDATVVSLSPSLGAVMAECDKELEVSP